MKVLRSAALTLGTLALLTTAACGGGDKISSSGGASSSSGAATSGGGSADKGAVVISGQNFTEMQIMAAMYGEVLTNAGYTATTKLVTTRDVYIKQMTDGNVDVVPEYLAGITDFLNTAANGDNAKTVSSHDPQATLQALKPLAASAKISMLEPSQATDQNAFFATKDFADQNKLTTLSDLAALHQPIKLAAPPDCKGRSDCEAGLAKVYGLDITEIVPLDFGSSQMKDAVKSGEVQLGETGTTDGSLSDLGLVILQDDKGIQPAQNLIPAVNSDFLSAHPDVADALNKLSSTLTTDDLAAMNIKVDLERQKPEDVAKAYLSDKGLI